MMMVNIFINFQIVIKFKPWLSNTNPFLYDELHAVSCQRKQKFYNILRNLTQTTLDLRL